jgi:hypothetical protein
VGDLPELPAEINASEPHSARIYDYFIGGKNHFAADRQTAAEVLRRSPAAHIAARENRSFLGRAVRYLTAEAGIRQFLDIGSGLPTTSNVHEVAQEVVPAARVVYADNDPLVLAHARALLTSTPAGRTAYIHADLREPGHAPDDGTRPGRHVRRGTDDARGGDDHAEARLQRRARLLAQLKLERRGDSTAS